MTVALVVIVLWLVALLAVVVMLLRAAKLEEKIGNVLALTDLLDRRCEVLEDQAVASYREAVEDVLSAPPCQACVELARLVAREHCIEWTHGRAIINARIRNGQLAPHTHEAVV